jgi:1-acyl-sn-glycerol-3-phosphate acyltransferase
MKVMIEQAIEMVKPHAGEMLRKAMLYPAMKLLTPVKVAGQGNLKEIEKSGEPVIFVANHSSHLDTPAVLAALPGKLRQRTRVAAAADYFYSSQWKGAMSSLLMNTVPFVRKGEGCVHSLERMGTVLDSENSLLIFPEGTRTPNGLTHTFKKGVGVLAARTGVRIVPVYIKGTFEAMPKGSKFPRAQQITVTFGEPVRFAKGASPCQITRQIENRVRELSGEIYHEITLAA